MVTLQAISLILSCALVVYSHYLLRKTRGIAEDVLEYYDEAQELYMQAELLHKERLKGPPLSVSAWKNYIVTLEGLEQFEMCERVKKAIEGKNDDELVTAPDGIITYTHEDSLYVRIL